MWILLTAFLFIALIGAAIFSWLMKVEADKRYRAMREELEAERDRFLIETEAIKARADRFEKHAKSEAEKQCLAMREELESEREHFVAETGAIKARAAPLERYAHIPGVEEQARRLKHQIEEKLDAANTRAMVIVSEAVAEGQRKAEALLASAREGLAKATAEGRQQAEALLASAREGLAKADAYARSVQAKADEKIAQLTAEADSKFRLTIAAAGDIRREAEKRAEAIAGKAYDVVRRADHYQGIADAMYNVVKGYGDRYAGSASTILDSWADEFAFADAGERLKLARERVRIMGKNRLAATCDYVEAARRELAINFVLEAFDGKVDSIQAKIRKDNYGTLRQQIVDAFHLINFNGKSFREARVTEEYLDARLDELKWAEVVQQLREEQREEQRAIREQIREEEKARKEHEKAIKQAQKDEDLLQKALEKARAEFAKAGETERERFRARMDELSEKLKEAEDRNRRAVSLAQQTRSGHVYVISNLGSFGEDVFKIGLTRRLDPMDRVRELGDASVPFAFDVHAMIHADDAPALESRLHRRFLGSQVNKMNRRKEFFRVPLREIRDSVDEIKDELGLTIQWTIAAEARQYRDTLALEKAMLSSPEARERWLAQQSKQPMLPLFDEEESGVEDDLVLVGSGA